MVKLTQEKQKQLICGDDHNIYIVGIKDYLSGRGPPKKLCQFNDTHINKCIALGQYKSEDIILTQKQGTLFYISLSQQKIIRRERQLTKGRNKIPKACMVFKLLNEELMIIGSRKQIYFWSLKESKIMTPLKTFATSSK